MRLGLVDSEVAGGPVDPAQRLPYHRRLAGLAWTGDAGQPVGSLFQAAEEGADLLALIGHGR